MAKKTATDSIKHRDKRANIPTHELADFVKDDEKSPKPALYPRDTSLDPQLVWKGKDEQDRSDLSIPTVPVYIQEKIHPQAIIEALRAQSASSDPQYELFGDFNGIEFEDLVDFYRHEQNWANRMILGDSLLVMNSLAEKEGLKGQVQMIYIDPPYGIEFGSNWQVSTRQRQLTDGKAEDVTRQPEQIKAFRDTWELGIHSYLAYLRDRLVVARDLLTESGSIFVQISDDNVHLVRCLLDEVFGSRNHVVTITVKKKGSQKSSLIDPVNDYVLWYTKTSRHDQGASVIKFRKLLQKRELDSETLDEFRSIELEDGRTFRLADLPSPDGTEVDYRLRPERIARDYPRSKLFRAWPITNGGERKNQNAQISLEGKMYSPPPGRCWSHTARSEDGRPTGMDRVGWAGRLMAPGGSVDFKRYLDDFGYKVISNWWDGLGGAADPIYVVQTNAEIIKRCMLMTTDPGDLVIDPTCGSGTTAFVAETWGRRWIVIDTSRVALALARTRLMSVKYPYFLLADSEEGVRKEAALTGISTQQAKVSNDIRKGFVYRRSTKLTSATIANNEELDEIHDRFQPLFNKALERLNSLSKKNWQSWEVPKEVEPDWGQGAAIEAYDDWLKLKAEYRVEIDESIARHSEIEHLYDRPFEVSKRVRVTGPFTVESLSPHRVLAADEDQPNTEKAAQDLSVSSWNFTESILENLRKAGVQTTKKGERVRFDLIEPFSGVYLQARGEYTDALGALRRVAVSLGPEHGTVGREHVKEAAKEAVRGTGFDLLQVCAFAFDATASEGAREFAPGTAGDGFAVAEETKFGKLPIQLVRMNPDLGMGDALLKKTGAGNLFMVFGEPDIRINKLKDGLIQVELLGLDVYDPTTGVVRNSKGTEDIACWFIDTKYNQESFFVRQAYFTGTENPYERLKKALKADIDESVWASINSATSRPFPVPESGRIAVKVINDYGDEVLKVYTV